MTTGRHVGARTAALAAIREFNIRDIAELAAGLTLIPGNLHHLARLESLAICAISGVPRGRRSVTRASAKRLLNDLVAAWVGQDDDPCTTLATETFTYNGGTHVFVAPDADCLFALRILCSVISRPGRFPNAFVDAATGLIQGICAISDLVVSSANLARNLRTTEVPDEQVRIPPETTLRGLCGSVRIQECELAALLARTMFRRSDLESLSATPNVAALPDPPHASEHLTTSPLLLLKDGLIVLAPHRLASGLVRRLLGMAAEMGIHSDLAEAFHEQLFLAVDRCLGRLGMRLSSGGLAACSDLAESIATHAIYQCDHDKVVHLAVVSDALLTKGNDIAVHWPTDELEPELAAARSLVPRLLAGGTPPISEWLSLVITGSIGRPYNISVSGPQHHEPILLLLPASDLEAIVLAERADRGPLLLWRYALSRQEFEARGRILEWSPLDTYALWRARDRSFPANVNLLVVDSAFGRTVREQAIEHYDWHAIAARDPEYTIEVVLADGPEQPLYVPRAAGRKRVEIAVCRAGLVIWIVSRRDLDESCEDRALWFDLGRMIAYWLSEFSGDMVSEFADIGITHKVIVAEFELLAKEAPALPDGYRIGQLSHRTISISVHPNFVDGYDDTNALERRFAADLVRSLLRLGGTHLHDADVARSVENVAPLGVKRMMHRINTGESPEFIATRKLSKPRYPNSWDLINARRKVVQASPLPDGGLSGKDATSWLNAAVCRIYAELRDRLNGFDAHVILERLLDNNEALVHEDAVRDATLASQLACYRFFDTMYKRLLDEGPRHASASMVTRFLIEHVATEPPTGSRLPSDFEFDAMLAMGLEIVIFGMASDIARFELADVRLRMSDGDMVIDRGTYSEAAQGCLLAQTQEQLRREQSRVRVRGHRTSPTPGELPELISRLEAASRHEFGVELSIIGKTLGEAVALAQESADSVIRVSREQFAHRVIEELQLDDATVDTTLSLLTLMPRPKYTGPPAGYDGSDIWPWRYNRRLSYIRRPFVQMRSKGGDAELHFTPGHVYRSSQNLIALITTGRLKAQTKGLSRIMGELTKDASDEFNEDVAQALRDRGFVVKTQVAKVGKEKIADLAGNTLGDIDVLCLDPIGTRVFAVECKDFQAARVPSEVRADLEALFVSTDRKRCAQDKHLKRVEWLQTHLDLVVSFMGGDPAVNRWSVQGAFAFSVALISPLLGHSRLPVWTLQELRSRTVP